MALKKKESNPFLTLMEHKLKQSTTLYFDDKQAPCQLDHEIFEDIKSKDCLIDLNSQEFPSLYAWHTLIGHFSEKLRASWKN